MKHLRHILIWFALIIVILLTIVNIVFLYQAVQKQNDDTVRNQSEINQLTDVNKVLVTEISELKDKINSIPEAQIGPIGKTGATGEKGDSITGEKGDSVKGDKGDSVKGDDGLTPTFNCNALKNRWEIKYGSDDAWSVLGEEPTRCTIKLEEILEIIESLNKE